MTTPSTSRTSDGGTLRDGAAKTRHPIRLYLSGGSNRSALGSVGVIAALVDLDEWRYVTEVVSVSGGSFTNAALVVEAPPAIDGDPLDALAAMTHRLRSDHMSPFATPRRTALTLGAVLVVILAVAAVLVACGVGPFTPPLPIALIIGVLVFPTSLLVLRRLLADGFRDVTNSVVGPQASTELSEKAPQRQHLFCAAGLSSGVPYTLWAGTKEPVITWGERLRDGYTVSDAVTASSSLPGVGCVTAPSALRRETLVDGGVIGIFGQQTHDGFRRSALDAHRGEDDNATHNIRRFAVDAGRHVISDGSRGSVLARLSTLYTLARWLQVSLEANYVNDLDDARGDTVIRLCWDPSMVPTVGPLGPALDALAKETTNLGLFGLRGQRALAPIVCGYARTRLALEPLTTSDQIHAGLERLGERLGLALVDRWNEYASPTHGQSRDRSEKVRG